MNAVEEFLNISLPYTVAFKQQCYVRCCQCKQASPQQPIKTWADFVQKDSCTKFIQNKVMKLFPCYHDNHLQCKMALV